MAKKRQRRRGENGRLGMALGERRGGVANNMALAVNIGGMAGHQHIGMAAAEWQQATWRWRQRENGESGDQAEKRMKKWRIGKAKHFASINQNAGAAGDGKAAASEKSAIWRGMKTSAINQ